MATSLFSSDPVSQGLTEAWLLEVCRRFERQDAGARSRGWRSASGSYRLRSVRLPAGSVAREEAILVLMDRVGPAIPGREELIRRFGLTSREADVAQCLSYGGSDREIAGELHLSPHTVRHHAESVFLKVGVNSRKALALYLSRV